MPGFRGMRRCAGCAPRLGRIILLLHGPTRNTAATLKDLWMHHTPLLSTIAIGMMLAFLFGTVAHRLRVSPLVGYLLAGVLMGPFTPGYVADQNIAHELSEIGIILLMFGVGLHFSLKDLLSVRTIAVPGAVVQ